MCGQNSTSQDISRRAGLLLGGQLGLLEGGLCWQGWQDLRALDLEQGSEMIGMELSRIAWRRAVK